MKIKTLCFVIILLLTASFVFSADAIIKSFTGKVEIQEKGSTAWKAVTQGQKIAPGTLISTGFNSNATIILGASEIFLKPLTRISFDELTEKGTIVKTDLNLKMGKVTADIKTTEGLKNDFTVRTPAATAAVRGTTFTIGVNNLQVNNGKVSYSNNIGQTRTVLGGSSSSVGTTGSSAASTPESTAEAAAQTFTVTTSMSKEGTGTAASKGVEAPTLKISLTW